LAGSLPLTVETSIPQSLGTSPRKRRAPLAIPSDTCSLVPDASLRSDDQEAAGQDQGYSEYLQNPDPLRGGAEDAEAVDHEPEDELGGDD
jgi:hypothetical protein